MFDFQAREARAVLGDAYDWTDAFTGGVHRVEARVSYTVTHRCKCQSIVSSDGNVVAVSPCTSHERSF